MADGEPVRDVKNHLLFEIATEVAHRGAATNPTVSLSFLLLTWLTCSGWYLLRHQVQGARDHRRIWRSIYAHWTAQSHLCTYLKPVP